MFEDIVNVSPTFMEALSRVPDYMYQPSYQVSAFRQPNLWQI